MISAILARLAPYAFILAVVAGAGDYFLARALLADQEAIGKAQQEGDTRVATLAAQSSDNARKAQSLADQATISQLRTALTRESGAAAARQKNLDDLAAANAALNQELDDVYKNSPSAQAWAAMAIPDAVLDAPGMCWWAAGTGFTAGCDGTGDQVRPAPGSGPGAVPAAPGPAQPPRQ